MKDKTVGWGRKLSFDIQYLHMSNSDKDNLTGQDERSQEYYFYYKKAFQSTLIHALKTLKLH